MHGQYFLVRDDVADDLVARLGSRDVALWIRGPLRSGALSPDLVAFVGLPWAMVIDEGFDATLVDAIQRAEQVDAPLVRRRGFIQVIESDIDKIDLPTRSLPFLLMNGRNASPGQSTFDFMKRQISMLGHVRASGVRQIFIVGGDDAGIPSGVADIWDGEFKPSLVVASPAPDASQSLRTTAGKITNLTLVPSPIEEVAEAVLRRYAEVYPPQQIMVRVRDRRGQRRVVDLTSGDEPERPVLNDYSLIEERDLRRLTPEELSDESFSDFFNGASQNWEPFAAGLPWIRDTATRRQLKSILSRLDSQGSDANAVAFISSESGAGGTTLARALAWEAASEGYPVLIARPLPFSVNALQLVNYMKRAKDLVNDAIINAEAIPESHNVGQDHDLYETPWLIVFDVVHWQHRAPELINFFHEVRRAGRPACILVVTSATPPLQFFNKTVFKQIASLNHVVSTEAANDLGTHLNRFLRSRGLAREQWQWEEFFNRHTVGRDSQAAFWVILSFWIRGQYDLTESIQTWIYSRFKKGCETEDLRQAVLEVAALSAERIPLPEALLRRSDGAWPMSVLLEDARTDLAALGLVRIDGHGSRHWALVHDVLGRYLLNAFFYDHEARTALGFEAAMTAEHLRLLILGQVARKVELGERHFRPLGEDFATTFLKIDPDHGYGSFTPFWREVLDILNQMPSPLRDASRVFRHHTAISRRRIAKMGVSAGVDSDEKVQLLTQATADLRYAMEFIDYTEDSESDLNLLNSLANAYFDLASAQLEAGEPDGVADEARQAGYEAAGRAYALSPSNPFVLETHVKSLLEQAGERRGDPSALCVEALNVLFAASDSKEVQYRRDQLAKMADAALELLLSQRTSVPRLSTRSGPIDVLVDAWIELASSFDDRSFFELDALSEGALDRAMEILGDPVGAGNVQVIRLTFDLLVRRAPFAFDRQLSLLEQLDVAGYRLPAQLQLERAILFYQVGRAAEGDREFRRLRSVWRRSEQYVYVQERLRWLLTPDHTARRVVDVVSASGYGARADAKVRDFGNALTPYRPEEHGLRDPKPGARFKTLVSFGINGPFLRPMSAPLAGS